MGRSAAQLGIMLEHDQLTHSHLAAGGRVVIFKHIQDGCPQQVQVILGESGSLAGQVGGDISLHPVQAVGYNVLAAHFGALLLRVRLRGDGHTGDGNLLRHDGVNAAGKAQLHRPAYLSAVQRTLDEGSHDCAEGADIVEIPAHKVPQLFVQMLVLLLGILQLVRVHAHKGAGFLVAGVQRYAVLDVDAIARLPFLCHLHIVADLSLQADVRHQPVAGLWVYTGHVARVGVTVGISVLHIEKHHKFIPVLDRLRHFHSPPFSYTASVSGDSSQGRRSPAGPASYGQDSSRPAIPSTQ